MGRAKGALESVRVRVIGEVSEFNDRPGYKAAYFTVCDDGAAMPCLMWRDSYDASGISLRCGTLVEMTGQFSAYVPKGRMQYTVRRLSLAGEGTLRMNVAEIARRLEAEGLMRPERRRALPSYPSRIAVVTSPRGKAIHDVIRTLRRRYPLAEVLVAGVPVEGDGAPAAIIEGLRVAQAADPDVILLVRGGGSYEDLMPFNSEALARAVAGSFVPIVTGIGHEPDTSIADMVSDLRASTPTAAAEAVAPAVDELSARLVKERRALGSALQGRLDRFANRVARIKDRPVFTDPHVLVGPSFQRIDHARDRLERALPERLARESQRIAHARARLVTVGPNVIQRTSHSIGMAAARLEDLSPLAILARGYSAVFSDHEKKRVVSSVEHVVAGDRIHIRVRDGHIGAVVTTTTEGTE
jgi:exodeoxyribonuclease VII large subunit